MEYTNDAILKTTYEKAGIKKATYKKYRILKRIIKKIQEDEFFTFSIIVSVVVLGMNFVILAEFIKIINLL
ncbi:MAG: hypothetical protein IKD76_03380 [Clostridia bacterium]|nr:hypothetical protein [Clostridia bacterium]